MLVISITSRIPVIAARTVAALEALGEPKRSARVPYSPAMEHGLAVLTRDRHFLEIRQVLVEFLPDD